MWGKFILIGIALMFVSSGAAADSRANQICRQQGLQGRVMWFDAEANIWELSTRQGVADMVGKCRDANINTIVVDVKPLSGLVLYNSRIAPKMTVFDGRPYPKNYDLLRTVIDEGHKAGIKVHAAINVFSEGSQTRKGGPAYEHEDWQCVQYDMDRTLGASDGTSFKLTCAGVPYSNEEVCLYGNDPDAAGKLPENTVYVRVRKDGTPEQWGIASGKAKLSPPEGGYLLVGNGKAGEWLKKMAESNTQFQFEGKGVMTRIGAVSNVHHALFINPLHPEARAYALSITKEICANYAIDGLVLDRMRYPNIYSDFSDITRKTFEKYIGHKVENWPDDVFKRDAVPGNDVIRGPLFKSWLKFRAKIMHDYLSDVRDIVKSSKRKIMLGIYVGSWYPLYYDVGVNWGSPEYATDLEWWPEGYQETGYANLVDYMCTGCYYTYPTRKEAKANGEEEWKSVEASAEESINAVKDATFVYGSLYLYQYKTRPDKFYDAMVECLEKTQGCMLFDLIYARDYNWWDVIKRAFATPQKAPHDVPGLLDKLRNQR